MQAARTIRERFGLEAAFDYTVGEKLMDFVTASRDHPAFARELPGFISEMRPMFSADEFCRLFAQLEREETGKDAESRDPNEDEVHDESPAGAAERVRQFTTIKEFLNAHSLGTSWRAFQGKRRACDPLSVQICRNAIAPQKRGARRAELQPIIEFRPASRARNIANDDRCGLLLPDANHEFLEFCPLAFPSCSKAPAFLAAARASENFSAVAIGRGCAYALLNVTRYIVRSLFRHGSRSPSWERARSICASDLDFGCPGRRWTVRSVRNRGVRFAITRLRRAGRTAEPKCFEVLRIANRPAAHARAQLDKPDRNRGD